MPAPARAALLGSGLFRPDWVPGLVQWSDFKQFGQLATTTDLFAGTGVATSSLASTAFTGVGTAFLTELAAGDLVYTNADVLIGTIASVTNDAAAVLQANGAAAITGAAFKIAKPNARISQANDLSGLGNHLVNATAAAQMLWVPGALPYALADGVNDYIKRTFAVAIAQPISLYIALRQVTWTVNDCVFDANGNAMGLRQSTVTPNTRLIAGANAAENSDAALGTDVILTCIFNNASSANRVNLKAAVAGDIVSVAAMNTLTLAGRADLVGAFANCRYYETAMYSGLHDTARQDVVIKGLGARNRIAVG